jgi:radical SAM superfamily enzyme YgiQ (UPF0313 family)
MYELFLAEAMKTHGLSQEIQIYTLLKKENPKKHFNEWRDADLIICWEFFSTKAPAYVLKYFELASIIKAELNVPLYFGGFWATAYGRYFEEFSVFDKIIEGYSIDCLVDSLSADIMTDNRFIDSSGDSNYEKYPLNLSYLATPGKYIFDNTLYGYISSFGCPRNCTFCFSNSARKVGSGFSARNIEQIKEDIDTLDNFYHFRSIVPKDLNIFYNKNRAFEFLEYLKDKGKRISVNLDVTVKDIDEYFFRKIREFGIIGDLYIGLESFNPEARKKVGKPFSTEELESAFELADKYEINITGNIILGFPWQTSEDVREEIKMALYYINRYKHVHIMMNIFIPEYGTDIQEEFFNDLHTKLSFQELVDIFLIDVVKHQSDIYGTQFSIIDVGKLFNAMRLINWSKRFENKTYGIRKNVLIAFRRLIEKDLEYPYFKSYFVRILTSSNATFLLVRFLLPIMKSQFSEIVSLRTFKYLFRYIHR